MIVSILRAIMCSRVFMVLISGTGPKPHYGSPDPVPELRLRASPWWALPPSSGARPAETSKARSLGAIRSAASTPSPRASIPTAMASPRAPAAT